MGCEIIQRSSGRVLNSIGPVKFFLLKFNLTFGRGSLVSCTAGV